jgi:hypothetical protein
MERSDQDINPYALDNYDPRPDELTFDAPNLTEPQQRVVAVLRTSDRNEFRRCRRKWAWSSHLRGNLGSDSAVSPLWLGSGFHFALEDFHGAKLYGTAMRAFAAYVVATHRRAGHSALPPTWQDDFDLGQGMLSYYTEHWLTTRDPLQTFSWEGRLQCEVNFRIAVPFDATHWGIDEVVYSGTLDRVIIDEEGILWIVEYKTAKAIQTSHYETDSQVTTYCWAASLLYPGYTVGGVIYQQHRKTIPEWPRILANGKLSTAKNQSTDYSFYRQAIINQYGSTEAASKEVLDTLNHLAQQEEVDRNKWVRRDKLFRNAHQMQAEGTKILLECAEMLNPDLSLYPNPTRECTFCQFKGPCIALDSGEDWDLELEMYTKPREPTYDSWRKHLPAPDELKD